MDPIEPIVPVTPPAPVTPPVEPVPAPAAPAAPAEPATPEKIQADREQALQDALDAALDQLNKPAEPADPVEPVEPVKPEPVVPAEPVKPVEPTPIPAAPKDEMAETMAKIIKNQEELNSKYTNLELRDEMIAMTSELRTAIIQYPNANEKAILAEIERGSEKSVTELAKESHEQYTQLVSNIEKATEEKVREQLKKEYEGKISVPQSTGSSSTPTPGDPNMPTFNRYQSNDDEWGKALKESKANLK